MKNNPKLTGVKIIIIILGIIDIIFGLFLLPTFVIFQGISFLFLLGMIYIIFGFSLIFKFLRTKLLLYGVIPLTLLSSLFFLMLGIDKNIPEYCKTPIMIQSICIGILSLICIVNIYFFTRPWIKEYFKK